MRLTKYNGREITIFPKPGKTVQWQRFITARYITIVKSDKEKIKERIKTTALSVPESNCHDQRNEKRRNRSQISPRWYILVMTVHRPKQDDLLSDIPV